MTVDVSILACWLITPAHLLTWDELWLISELDAAQLSLFPAAVSGGGEDAEMQTLNSPSPKGMYNANQCLYLEKLLGESHSVALTYLSSIACI